MRKAIILIMAVLLTGCDQDPPQAPAGSNITGNGYVVERLFTHDGTTVSRFKDRTTGRYVYFTDTGGDVQSSHTENCGKACTKTVETQTLGRCSICKPNLPMYGAPKQ